MPKKYYWLKLKDDWFNSKIIKKLRKIAGGDTYTIIYLKMQLLSLKNEGKLFYEGVEDSFEEELALDLDEDIDNVTVTVSYLKKCGLLEVTNADEYILTEVPNVIGSESESAERMRKMRANNNKKLLEDKTSQCDGTVTKCDTEIDIEKEIEKEIDINNFARSSGKQNSVPEADVEALILNDGSEWRPSEALFAEYVRLYPNVEVKQQFNEMRSWCISNPNHRKTRRGITRFVNGWLSREQDKGGRKGTQQVQRTSNGFNQFQKNDYDFESIEHGILANGGD